MIKVALIVHIVWIVIMILFLGALLPGCASYTEAEQYDDHITQSAKIEAIKRVDLNSDTPVQELKDNAKRLKCEFKCSDNCAKLLDATDKAVQCFKGQCYRVQFNIGQCLMQCFDFCNADFYGDDKAKLRKARNDQRHTPQWVRDIRGSDGPINSDRR